MPNYIYGSFVFPTQIQVSSQCDILESKNRPCRTPDHLTLCSIHPSEKTKGSPK